MMVDFPEGNQAVTPTSAAKAQAQPQWADLVCTDRPRQRFKMSVPRCADPQFPRAGRPGQHKQRRVPPNAP